MSPRAVGEIAPDFSLASAPGPDLVTLSELSGQTVVVLFVPLAFSGVCTDEFCQVRDQWSAWADVGATVLGISVDSPFTVKRWAEDMGIPFQVLSDFNKETATAYDVIYEDWWGLRGVAKRSAFVIDGDRRIVYAWSSEDADVLPPYDEILQAVRDA